MLEHLVNFEPPVTEVTGRAVTTLDKATPEETLNAQVKTTEWLENLGVQNDAKVLKDAEANASRKVFASLASAAPVAEINHQLTQIKTPEAVRHLVTMLSAYDWEFVEQAKQLRGMAVAKILEETNHPDARVRLKALDMLGRVTEVALFTERIEIRKTDLTDEEIDRKLKDKLAKFMNVTDIEIEDIIEKTQHHVIDENQRPDINAA